MQISKTLLVTGLGAACLITLSVRGVDNDAQARAREALEKVLNSPSSPAPVPAAISAAADPETITKAREALHQKMQELDTVPATQPPAAFPPPSAPAADSEAIAKARAAMRQKLQELPPEPVPAPVAVAAAKPAPTAPPPPPPPSSRVRPTPPPAPPAPTAPPATQPKAKAGMEFPPLEAPPSSITAQQQQQLDELLQKYRADLISPEQYQAERAKILGPH